MSEVEAAFSAFSVSSSTSMSSSILSSKPRLLKPENQDFEYISKLINQSCGSTLNIHQVVLNSGSLLHKRGFVDFQFGTTVYTGPIPYTKHDRSRGMTLELAINLILFQKVSSLNSTVRLKFIPVKKYDMEIGVI